MKKTNFLSLLTIGLVLFASLSGCKKNDNDDDNNNNNNNGPWSEIGVDFFNDGIYAMCADDAGNIYAGGGFTNSNGKSFVAKWNGTAWSQLGGDLDIDNGIVTTMCIDPFGNIYVGGNFSDVNGDGYLIKWNGTSWVNLPSMQNLASSTSIASDAAGNIYVASASFVAMWNGSTWTQMNMAGFNHWVNGVGVHGSTIYVAGGGFTGGTL